MHTDPWILCGGNVFNVNIAKEKSTKLTHADFSMHKYPLMKFSTTNNFSNKNPSINYHIYFKTRKKHAWAYNLELYSKDFHNYVFPIDIVKEKNKINKSL